MMRLLEKQHRRPTLRPSAYTLIELLVALVLVGVLMMGVWALLKNWGRLYDRGKQRTEKAQLVRSLSDQITDDLHEVTYRVPPRRGRRPVRATLDTAVGLVGEKDWMVLDILHAITPYHQTSAAAATSDSGTSVPAEEQQWAVRSPELQRVVYWFQPHAAEDAATPLAEGEAPPFGGLLRLAVAREYFSDLANLDRGTTPVARSRTSLRSQVELICQTVTTPEDAAGSGIADTGGGALGAVSSTTETPAADVGRPTWLPGVLQQDEVPRVGWWEFRYYDGVKWQESWDSREQGRLPVAVEVKFELVDLPEEGTPAATDEQQAEAALQDAGDQQNEKELNNTALLEGQPPEWSGQSDTANGLASAEPESPTYYRCVVYLEPPKKWSQPASQPEDAFDEASDQTEAPTGAR